MRRGGEREPAEPVGAGGRGPGRRPALRRGAVLIAALVFALHPGSTAAQEELDVPAMAESPRQFQLSVTAGGMFWSDDPALDVDGLALFGLDVERLLTRWTSVRLAGAYGSTTVSSPARAAEVNAAVFEVGVTARAALPSLRRAGVIPFAALGLGSVLFDPRPTGLTTRSQNTLSYGAGVQARILARVGLRAEWRHYEAELENLFDATDRTGTTRDADRIQASAFWTF